MLACLMHPSFPLPTVSNFSHTKNCYSDKSILIHKQGSTEARCMIILPRSTPHTTVSSEKTGGVVAWENVWL